MKNQALKIETIRSKWDTIQGTSSYNYNAEISADGQTATIYGTTRRNNTPFSVSFAIGGKCVTGSYNLIYTGNIVKFGKTYVEVKASGERTKRIKWYEFIELNHDFNWDAIAAHNIEEMHYI